MTTTTLSSPASHEGDTDFSTPEGLQRFAQNQFDTKLPRKLLELHPTVEVTRAPDGFSIRLSVTGEGFQGPKSEVRVYPLKRFESESRVRSAIWHQYSRLLRDLKLIPLPSDDDE